MGGGGELRFDYAMDMASPLPLSCGRLTRTAGAKVALAALAAPPEASPKARLKPYFPRACPQDDVSSTRQTLTKNTEKKY